MCGRLIRKSLCTREVFELPSELYHEDLCTTPRLFARAGFIATIKPVVYYYTANDSSLTGSLQQKHLEDVFWTFGDWYKQAQSAGLLSTLSESIICGIERLLNTLGSRILASSATDQTKLALFEYLKEQIAAYPLTIRGTSDPRTKQLIESFSAGLEGNSLLRELSANYGSTLATAFSPVEFPLGYGPSKIAERLRGRVTFICEVDYQLRCAATIANALADRDIESAILDNSSFASGGRRALKTAPELSSRCFVEAVKNPPYERDWLATASLVMTFNDWSPYIRDALEYRALLNLPSVACVEGISDFLRVDLEAYRLLPYRRSDHLILAGKHDEQFFQDRDASVGGLPNVHALTAKTAIFPKNPLAVINVNFTYGQMEWARDSFVAEAVAACAAVPIDYQITRHPSDTAPLGRVNISEQNQYEQIDACSVLISRFATGIIEALASGKPVVYFNPHNEQVTKFQNPLGAFRIARSSAELTKAIGATLKDIEAGVDFRDQARRFLDLHTNYNPPSVASQTIAATLAGHLEDYQNAVSSSEAFFEAQLSPSKRPQPEGQVLGVFSRHEHANVNEEEMVALLFGNRQGLMLDVGANFGNSCDVFLSRNWIVHAFEPDPNNRAVLERDFGHHQRLTVNPEAVSDTAGQEVPFFASEESTGISGLSAFTPGHEQIGTATTTTLRDYLEEKELGNVQFLKIDVEGYDKFVLDGFPWEKSQPDVVLVEFEDSKTVPLGYDCHDLASMLISKGYTVYTSEWHPIIRYGIAHDWRRLARYNSEEDLSQTWGNFFAFREPPDERELKDAALRVLKGSFAPNRGVQGASDSRGALKKISRTILDKTLMAIVSAIKVLARTKNGARIKRELERLYITHVGRS